MQSHLSHMNRPSPEENIRDLIHQPTSRRSALLSWWYRLTAPPEPATNSTFEQREVVRRGRLASLLLTLIASFPVLYIIPSGIFGPNKRLIGVGAGLFVVLCFALWFNKRGRIYAAGAIGVLAIAFGLSMAILTTPGGLGASEVPIFDLLIAIELVSISLLPIPFVFVVASLNTCFILIAFNFLHHAPSLDALIAQGNTITLIARPISLQWIVAIVLSVLLNSTLNALRRADRAEVIARLEHRIAQQGQQAEQQKRELEESIQSIVQVHMAVANGNLKARVPYHEGNVLWSVAGPLNNLLNRFQRALQIEQEYEQRSQQFKLAAQNERALQQIVRELLRDPAYVHNHPRIQIVIDQLRQQYAQGASYSHIGEQRPAY